MIDRRYVEVLRRDLSVGWKGLAAGLVPLLLIALLSQQAVRSFEEDRYTFEDAQATAAGTPREAWIVQDGRDLTLHVRIDDLPQDPPDGVTVGAFLRGSEPQVAVAAQVDNGTVEYGVLEVTDSSDRRRGGLRAVVSWRNGTYNPLTGGSQGPVEIPWTARTRLAVELDHDTGAPPPAGVPDLNLALLGPDGEVLAESAGDPGERGVEELEYRPDVPPQEVTIRIEGEDPKPNVNVDYDLRITDVVEVLPEVGSDGGGPDVVEPLTGAWDAAAGEVRIVVPLDRVVESSRGSYPLSYTPFVAEDGSVVAGGQQGGSRGIYYTEAATEGNAFADDRLTPMFGNLLLIALVAFSIAAFLVYGREAMQGTVRTLLHYPLSYGEVHTVKAASAMVLPTAAVAAYAVLVLPHQARAMDVPAGQTMGVALAVLGAALLAVAVIALWAWGLSSFVAKSTGRLVLAYHRAFLVLFIGAIVTTETFLKFVLVGLLVAFGVIKTQGQVDTMRDLAEAVAPVSPIHAAGRLLAKAFGATPGLDLHLVVPITAVLVFLGVTAGRTLYPDIYLQESAT